MVFSLQTNVKALGLSKRTTNALINNGIETPQDLLALTEDELRGLRGLGETGMNELRKLFQRGVREEAEAAPAFSFGGYLKQVQRSERNFHVVVDYYNGGADITLQDVADKYEITRSRAQQLIAGGTRRLCDAFENGAIDLAIVGLLNEYADKRTEIHELRVPDEAFTGVGVAFLLAAFRPARYKIYARSGLNGVWFVRADDGIDGIMDVLISELRHRSEPLAIAEIEKLYSVNEELVISVEGVIEKDGYVTHCRNKLATGTERFQRITRCLENLGRPASVAEIIVRTGLADGQVRGAITNKDLYVNVGRTVYDLAERTYEGVAADELAVKLLTAEDRAVKTDVVIKYIQRYYPMNKANITVTLLNSSAVYIHENYLLLNGWGLDKIEVNTEKYHYLIPLEQAVLEVMVASDEVFDCEKIAEGLKKYNGAVSTNLNSIKATLGRLVDQEEILRVGGVKSGCYVRNSATEIPNHIVRESRQPNWYQEICDCVERLGDVFTLREIYKFEEKLSEKFPDNSNVRAKIRQQIQLMRDRGLICMLAPGVYERCKKSIMV